MVFRLETKTPPAASSGKYYPTVDSRCYACEVFGGDEGKCIPEAWSLRLQRDRGRPCPRVELDPGNIQAFALVQFLIHDDLKPLGGAAFDALTADLSLEERQSIIGRVARCLQNGEVMTILHPSFSNAGPES